VPRVPVSGTWVLGLTFSFRSNKFPQLTRIGPVAEAKSFGSVSSGIGHNLTPIFLDPSTHSKAEGGRCSRIGITQE